MVSYGNRLCIIGGLMMQYQTPEHKVLLPDIRKMPIKEMVIEEDLINRCLNIDLKCIIDLSFYLPSCLDCRQIYETNCHKVQSDLQRKCVSRLRMSVDFIATA